MGKAGVLSGRRWAFTYNNYKNSEVLEMVERFSSMASCKFIFQREIAPTTGTPHLQGYCEFSTSRDFTFQNKFPKGMHWGKARKSKEDNVDYCMKCKTKEEGYPIYTNMELPRPKFDPLAGKELYYFQQQIKDLVSERADPAGRTIHWYWDPEGNCGKTALIKHLILAAPDKRTMVGGASKDAAFAVTQLKKVPEVVFFNVVRAQENFVSYVALESLRDGLMFSVKYESSMWCEDGPHVIVFANFPPEEEKLSADRWHIVRACKCVEAECKCKRVAEMRAFIEGFEPSN